MDIIITHFNYFLTKTFKSFGFNVLRVDDFKKAIVEYIKKETNLENIELETPPHHEMGDYAFPCFVLAKEWKKNPNDIAFDLSRKFRPNNLVTEAKAVGPYLNFYTNNTKIGRAHV